MNDRFINLANDSELRMDLAKIKKKAFKEFQEEKVFLDSIEAAKLITPEVAAFYRLKNTFDSIKIEQYDGSRPNFSNPIFLHPFKAIPMSPSPYAFSWVHLTFYDDWIGLYFDQFYLKGKISRDSNTLDSIYTQIHKSVLPDSLINILLLKHALFSCEKLDGDYCTQNIQRFGKDEDNKVVHDWLYQKYIEKVRDNKSHH
jgi:hypothetical protein